MKKLKFVNSKYLNKMYYMEYYFLNYKITLLPPTFSIYNLGQPLGFTAVDI